MTASNRFRRWLSYFTFGPIYKGYGTTTQPSDLLSVATDIDIVDINQATFFKIRQDLGPFEVRQVITKEDNTTVYVVYNTVNDRTFEMSKQWFNFFFEENTDSELNFRSFENSQK